MKIDKNLAVQALSKVSSDRAFWCNDGKIFYALEDLSAALKVMHPAIYSYHANSQKNDFSAWIRDVFCDKILAESLAKAKSKTDAARKLSLRIAYLKKLAR